MNQDPSSASGTALPNLRTLLRGLNGLAESLLRARTRQEDVWEHALTISRLASLGVARDDCRDVIARELLVADGKLTASSRIVLTDAGLAVMQIAIPDGAVRPIYNIDFRELSVVGDLILPLAVQARNLATVLASIERADWKPRVVKPLDGSPGGNDPHHLCNAACSLNDHRSLIHFRADDGAVRWRWRTSAETTAMRRSATSR